MPKKDDLPYMPFYVGDWHKATDIQCLDYELKGIWFEMLCYMWEGKERGVLNYTEEQLARLLRLPQQVLKQKLQQLLDFGVYSVRKSDGAIFCRRMIKDQEIRETKQKAGQLGGKTTANKYFAKAGAKAKTVANADIDIETDIETEVVYEYLGVKQFVSLFNDFRKHRITMKAQLTERAETIILNKLHSVDIKTALSMLEKSIECGWKSVFPPEKEDKPYADVQ